MDRPIITGLVSISVLAVGVGGTDGDTTGIMAGIMVGGVAAGAIDTTADTAGIARLSG